jgi:hypothetical protein
MFVLCVYTISSAVDKQTEIRSQKHKVKAVRLEAVLEVEPHTRRQRHAASFKHTTCRQRADEAQAIM